MIRKIIIIAVWVILIAATGIYMSFTSKQHDAVICEDLSIQINYPSDHYFIIEDDILQYLSRSGFTIKGAELSTINAGDIEESLYLIPYVDKAEVYVTIDGEVKITIMQRDPILKVYNKSNDYYYIDENGYLMPSSDKYTARLLVAHGEINDYYLSFTRVCGEDSLITDSVMASKPLYKVYKMAQFISRDPFWKAMIEEIYVNDKNEIELYTKIGDAAVIFGDIDDMSEKFSKLLVFYKEGLSKYGWSRYKKINLKFKDQVVCSKS